MAWSPMGKSSSFGLQYVFCTTTRENNDKSLNKVDLHNCRLYVKIEIETRVCAQMVMMIRLTEGLFDKSRMKRSDIYSNKKVTSVLYGSVSFDPIMLSPQK